ncbi:MAG: DUF2948 family protein [Sneathiella sp.]|nr:DUF2948 family protein [Sneathiella sp.]
MSEGLKLSAMEAEDITVLSAAMVGSITSPGEMSYSQTVRHFTLTASRFMWEKYGSSTPSALRVRSGLFFSDILSVKASGISQGTPTSVMELLTISCTSGEDGAAEIRLNFAGGGILCLDAECINVTLTDVGDPWKADGIPSYEGDITGSD